MIPVNVLIEGQSDEYVAKRLLLYQGLEPGTIYGNKGKDHLLKRLPNYNVAAQHSPWFSIVDLDTEPCVAKIIGLWLPQPSKWMCLRVAVRAIEAWLMADRESMAAFLAVSPSKLPFNPDKLANPKDTLINIARQSSKSSVREDIVPRKNSGARVGSLYVARLKEFTEKHWQPEIAAQSSESLQ